MKNNLKFLALSLMIALAQVSFSESVKIEKDPKDNKVHGGAGHVVIGKGNEVGDSKDSTKENAVAVGKGNTASGKDSLAFGDGNTASGLTSSAFGGGNTASGLTSSAFGVDNTASGQNSLAFGANNEAGAERSLAFGDGNTATGKQSSSFGYKNEASGENSLAFGDGNTASGLTSSAFGKGNTAIGESSLAIGLNNTAEGKGSSAFGGGNTTVGIGGSAFGIKNEAAGKESSAFGYWNTASGEASTALGYQTFVSGEGSGAFGRGNHNDTDYEYKIEGKDSWAIGSYNKIAAGSDNNHILGNNVSIGTGISNVVVLGNNSTVKESNVVSVGSENLQRRIVNVAKGTNDTDAVNKKQLDEAIASIGNGGSGGSGAVPNAYTKTESDRKFLDKNTYNTDKANLATKAELNNKVNKDGSNLSASDVAALKAKLSVATVDSIANTAAGTGSAGLGHGNVVSGNYSTAVGYKNEVSGNNSGAFGDPNIVTGHRSYAFGNDNKIAGNDNFVMGSNVVIGAGITNSVALGNNSAVSGSNEVSVGSATLKRKITNVADGELSATSTDAVTGRQLYGVRKEFSDVKNEVRGIGSLSAALSALHPMQYDPHAPNQIMAGVGTYRSKNAIAVGLTHYFKENVMMTAGVALSNERKTSTMANLGFTWKIGKGGSSSMAAPTQMVHDEMNRLAKENNNLKAQLNTQNDRIKAQDDKINAQAQENQDLKERMKSLEAKLNMIMKSKK